MKTKTKRKLIRLLNVIMIMFVGLNLFSSVFGSKVYAFEVSLGSILGNGALAGLSVATGGLPLIFLNIIKLGIIVAGLVLQVIMSAAYSSFEGSLEWTSLSDIIFAGSNGASRFLDVNFFDFNGLSTNDPLYIFRTAIAKWYYILRLISSAILLVILIYVGIRMALSTIASEQAKYKQMLVDWITSLALLFLLHYIIMFVITVNSSLVQALSTICTDSTGSMIGELVGMMFWIGMEGILAAVIYFIFVGQIFTFFLLYMRRMITVGFLIMIAPLITITYSIDKIGDGKAQALNTWLKELVYNILIQPFYCIIFMSFFDAIDRMISNGQFTIGAYIFAIVVMRFMIKKAEDIFRKIFHFDASSMSSVSESGQDVVNATKKLREYGTKTGVAFVNFKAAGGMKAAKKAYKDFKENNKARSQLKRAYEQNQNNAAGTYASFKEYENSTEGKEELGKIKERNRVEEEKAKKETVRQRAEKLEKRRNERNAERERKISEKAEKQLREEMGDRGYETLKARADGGDEDAKRIIAEKENKIRKGSFPKRTIKGVAKGAGNAARGAANAASNVAGNVSEGVKRFTQSDHGKIAIAGIKDSMKLVPVVAMGAFAMGATGKLDDVVALGKEGRKLAEVMFENSGRTLAKHTTETMQKLIQLTGASPEEAGKIINNINVQGGMDQYAAKNMREQMEKLFQKISDAFGGGDDGQAKAQDFVTQLRLSATTSDEDIDLDKLVDDLNLNDDSEKKDILKEANKYTQAYLESMIYSYLTAAKGVGIDSDEIGDKVTHKLQKITIVNQDNSQTINNNTTNHNTFNGSNGNQNTNNP